MEKLESAIKNNILEVLFEFYTYPHCGKVAWREDCTLSLAAAVLYSTNEHLSAPLEKLKFYYLGFF